MTWRDHMRPIIADIINRCAVKDEESIRRALRAERPHWTKHKGHLAKTWQDEVNVQLGVKAKRLATKESKRRIAEDSEAGQQFLFDEVTATVERV